MRKNIQMRLVLLFSFMLATLSSCNNDDKIANEQKPRIDSRATGNTVVEGRTWTWGSLESQQLRFTEFFSGDTLIGGMGYKKLYRHFIRNGRIEYVCAMREEERKVFCVERGQAIEDIVYDFNLEKGDKLSFSDHETIVVDSVTFEGGCHIHFTFYTGREAIKAHWIEGIGATIGELSKSHLLGAEGTSILLYCEEGGMKIWEQN